MKPCLNNSQITAVIQICLLLQSQTVIQPFPLLRSYKLIQSLVSSSSEALILQHFTKNINFPYSSHFSHRSSNHSSDGSGVCVLSESKYRQERKSKSSFGKRLLDIFRKVVRGSSSERRKKRVVYLIS